MYTLLKKLAYLLLTLAIVNTSVQAVYAFSDNCNDMQMSEHQSKEPAHCMSQKIKEPCLCENCNCDMCITLQANINSPTNLFVFEKSLTDSSTEETRNQYTHYFFNPLLRPPIT